MVQINPVNVLGSVMGGLQVRDTMQGMERRNALAQAAEAFGVDSPQFKNALAVADPVKAYAFQQGDRRMDMQADQFGQTMDLNERQFASQDQDRQARLQIARQNAARQGAALAMRMSAEERAQDAAALDRALAAATTAQTPEDWDRIMTGFGEQGAPFVGQFDRREEIFAGVMGLKDALESQQGSDTRYRVGDQLVDADGNIVFSATAPTQTFRNATPEEAAEYGAAAGQFGPDGRFYPINPPSGMSVEVGADGQVRLAQGPGAQAKPFTEGQSKDNVYVVRARGALETLDQVGADELASFGQRAANMDPTGVVRGAVQSDTFQVGQQAGNEFLQAVLRKDTGAAITAQEQDLYGETYLPQPGDNPAVLAEKARARRRAIAAIEAGMSPAQMVAVERGLTAGQEQAPADPPPQAASTVPPRPSDLSPDGNWPSQEDWDRMTPEMRALFQ